MRPFVRCSAPLGLRARRERPRAHLREEPRDGRRVEGDGLGVAAASAGLARALACDDGTAAALLRTYGVPQIRQAGDLKVGLWAPGDALDLDDAERAETKTYFDAAVQCERDFWLMARAETSGEL